MNENKWIKLKLKRLLLFQIFQEFTFPLYITKQKFIERKTSIISSKNREQQSGATVNIVIQYKTESVVDPS